MFELDPHSSHMMPAHFGAAQRPANATMWYRDITSMVIAFRTDRKKLAAYLPAPFEVAEDAIVTVTYACNRQVDWLAGHGYNLIAVNAAAVFRGEEETLEGDYTLVIWENLADPILTGRELQGIPKVYADIPEHTVFDGRWETAASHFGSRFLDMQIDDLRAPTEQEIVDNAAEKAGKDNPMGWRFMPGLLGFGQSLNEFVTYPSQTDITEAFVGHGSLSWEHMTWEQNPTQHHIINAIADLPVLEYLPAIVAKGSTNLILPERLPRLIK
ncbi:MAG: acetoacetate decarboxylase family protein [Halieaceae bacterium]